MNPTSEEILDESNPICAFMRARRRSKSFAGTVRVTLDGVNGQSTDGFYISPHNGTVAGNNQSIYCDDFNNEVDIGQTWAADVIKLVNVPLDNEKLHVMGFSPKGTA